MFQVTVPRLEEQYKVKAGSPLSLPCVPPQPGGEVTVEWRHGDTETHSQDITVDTDTGEESCYCAKLHLKTLKHETGENVSLGENKQIQMKPIGNNGGDEMILTMT